MASNFREYSSFQSKCELLTLFGTKFTVPVVGGIQVWYVEGFLHLTVF